MTNEEAYGMNEKVTEWLHNMRVNAPYVEQDFERFVDKIVDQDKRNVAIFGAGASLKMLENDMEKVAKANLCFVSPTVLPWFVYHAGRQPDAIFNIDKHPMLAGITMNWGAPETPVILSPMVSHTWTDVPGDFYWFMNILMGNKPLTAFIEGTFKYKNWDEDPKKREKLLETSCPQQGCITNEIIFLTYLAMARSGIENLICVGCDYGYWKNLGRVPGNPDEPYPEHSTQGGDPIQWGQWKTNKQMVNYAYQEALVWQQFKFRLWRVGPTIMDFLPKLTRRQLINGRTPKYPSEAWIKKSAERFMTTFSGRMEKPEQEATP